MTALIGLKKRVFEFDWPNTSSSLVPSNLRRNTLEDAVYHLVYILRSRKRSNDTRSIDDVKDTLLNAVRLDTIISFSDLAMFIDEHTFLHVCIFTFASSKGREANPLSPMEFILSARNYCLHANFGNRLTLSKKDSRLFRDTLI